LPEENEDSYDPVLDDELKLLLIEYRDGKLTVAQLLQLIDSACRDYLDFKKKKGSYAKEKTQ